MQNYNDKNGLKFLFPRRWYRLSRKRDKKRKKQEKKTKKDNRDRKEKKISGAVVRREKNTFHLDDSLWNSNDLRCFPPATANTENKKLKKGKKRINRNEGNKRERSRWKCYCFNLLRCVHASLYARTCPSVGPSLTLSSKSAAIIRFCSFGSSSRSPT